MALAKLCFDTLMEEGVKAKIALEAGVCTPAVEKVIEANTLLSGIGFESAGLAGAHAIHNGFTVLEECHHMYHGEKVAFGTLTQLVLENVPLDELEDIILWCIEVGLPVTLAELGAENVTDDQLMEVAKTACAETDTLHNMPFEVTPETLGGIDPYKQVNAVSKAERQHFEELITHFPFTVTGTRGFREAIITQGGVSVKEIRPGTMEAKKKEGLYFVGEVLDLDALTGGFNLQIAWASAHAAAEEIRAKEEQE